MCASEPCPSNGRPRSYGVELDVDGVVADGVAYLRLATDCLLMLETAGGLSPGDHLPISVPSARVRMTMVGS